VNRVRNRIAASRGNARSETGMRSIIDIGHCGGSLLPFPDYIARCS